MTFLSNDLRTDQPKRVGRVDQCSFCENFSQNSKQTDQTGWFDYVHGVDIFKHLRKLF